jgi:integrase/recombinase XerD
LFEYYLAWQRQVGEIKTWKDFSDLIGIDHVYLHTFAVMFLRNGGSSLALQRLLGHSTMEMVRVYVKLSEVDLQQAHRRASPVENLRL